MDTPYFQFVVIIYKTIAPYTSQQNGISEKENIILKEMVNFMMSYSVLSQGFWGEAMAVVRLPNPKLKLWVKEALNASLLDMLSIPRLLVVPEEVTKEVVTQQPGPKLRKSKKNRTPKNFGPKFQLYLIEGTRDEVSDQHSYCFNVEDDPKTFDEAMKSQDVAFWKKAINDEMDSIMGTNTWMDVKTSFLNGELDEEVYMNQPRDFSMSGNENKVCKLIKSLYGLKQAPKQWHQKFDEVVLTHGYLLNQADKCVNSKFDETGILVIKILYEGHGEVLKKFNYFDCTPVSTSMDTSEKLMPNNGHVVSQLEYSKVIGCLMYVMTYTRPGIAFAVGKLSKYTSNPEGYTDARWISNTEDNSSIIG
nr:hypothetical protein [Tanacetum cinerariifolium]